MRRVGSMMMFTAPAPIFKKSSQSKEIKDMNDVMYHSVGETDCWHPPVEREVGENWSEGEEKGAKHQTTSPESLTISQL